MPAWGGSCRSLACVGPERIRSIAPRAGRPPRVFAEDPGCAAAPGSKRPRETRCSAPGRAPGASLVGACTGSLGRSVGARATPSVFSTAVIVAGSPRSSSSVIVSGSACLRSRVFMASPRPSLLRPRRGDPFLAASGPSARAPSPDSLIEDYPAVPGLRATEHLTSQVLSTITSGDALRTRTQVRSHGRQSGAACAPLRCRGGAPERRDRDRRDPVAQRERPGALRQVRRWSAGKPD